MGPLVERARSERALGEDAMPFRLPGGGGGAEDGSRSRRVGPHLPRVAHGEVGQRAQRCSRVWSICPTATSMSAARAPSRPPDCLPWGVFRCEAAMA